MDDSSGGSNVWKYVGIGCGIAALLSICAVGGCFACGAAGIGGIVAATEAPATAAHGFFSDLRSHDDAAAYARMSEPYRAVHPQADFTASVASVPGLATNTDSTFTGRAINGTTATLTGVLSTPSGALPVVMALHDSGGSTWVIDSVIVSGRPL
jgi:hypothetical protein